MIITGAENRRTLFSGTQPPDQQEQIQMPLFTPIQE